MKNGKIFLLVLLFAASVFSQSIYYNRTELGFTPAGAMKFGLYGFDNPALLAQVNHTDFAFSWTTMNGSWNDARKWDAYLAIPNIGFSMHNRNMNGLGANEYNLSAALGSEAASLGAGYTWDRGDHSLSNPDCWTFGFLSRPSEVLSFGISEYLPAEGRSETVLELAVRPLKTEVLSVFGDYVAKKDYVAQESKWSAGIALEAFPGIRLTGRYFDDKSMRAGLQFELGSVGVSSQSHFDANGKYAYNSYGIRIGAFDRNIFLKNPKQDAYYAVNLIQGIDYTRYKYFDSRLKLSEILSDLDAVENDPSVKGVFINASGMNGNREILWEVREKLKEVRLAGKEVIVYIDRAGINEYHFASVADKIIMDPMGSLMFEGYIMGRSFLKGTLEKLGIGCDEFRFFKYKSAMENYSRDKMSDADREQRQKIADDWYRLAKDDITASGRISGERFDSLVNDVVLLNPQEALQYKLVDSLVRLDLLQEYFSRHDNRFVSSKELLDNRLPHDARWGAKPKIAIIYALGACDMETGITARHLVNDVRNAVNDESVKAIVLRVDSPGGDALASDYIADVLHRAKGKKPIIVSQGFVAASGGYWLSMYADTIVAAPGTLTGSIGVIGAFFYDNGFKTMIGASTDHVQKGDHADIGFGFVLPLLNLALPDRDVTKEERAKIEASIRYWYNEFVDKVAIGRNRKSDYIATIAQGRIWSGYDGLKIGLVDVLGGMDKAIDIARTKAGLSKGGYDIVEYPESKTINWDIFTPKLMSTEAAVDSPALQNLRYRMQYNGKPLFMVPLDFDLQ